MSRCDKDVILAQRFSTLRAEAMIETIGNVPDNEGTNAGIRIGIDPLGGLDPAAGTVVWSGGFESSDARWRRLCTAEVGVSLTTVATVFIERRHVSGFTVTRSALDNVGIWFDGSRYVEEEPLRPTSGVRHWQLFD